MAFDYMNGHSFKGMKDSQIINEIIKHFDPIIITKPRWASLNVVVFKITDKFSGIKIGMYADENGNIGFSDMYPVELEQREYAKLIKNKSVIEKCQNAYDNYMFDEISDSRRVNDFYYNDKSGTMRNYSDLSEQEKHNELVQTYEYAFTYMINNLDSYIDTTNDRAVKDYITEQVYVFMDNDPMFDKDQIELHGINYDNGFAEDLIDFLYNEFLEQ